MILHLSKVDGQQVQFIFFNYLWKAGLSLEVVVQLWHHALDFDYKWRHIVPYTLVSISQVDRGRHITHTIMFFLKITLFLNIILEDYFRNGRHWEHYQYNGLGFTCFKISGGASVVS